MTRYRTVAMLVGAGLCAALFIYVRDSAVRQDASVAVEGRGSAAPPPVDGNADGGSASETSPVEEQSRAGRTIENFALETVGDAPVQVSLDDWSETPVVVIVFLGTNCPLAERYSARLSTIAEDFSGRAAVLGVFSNRGDDPQEIRHFADERHLSFPVLKDWDNRLADELAAEKTPEAFVLARHDEQPGRVVSYVGRIDDQFKVNVHGTQARSHDLRNAIDAALSGEDLVPREVACEGCVIERRPEGAPAQRPTVAFAEVRWILEQHCVMCHRAGQPGFSLEDPADVRDMASNIVYRTSPHREGRHRMPPWNARTGIDSGFTMSRLLLSEKDWNALATWYDEGAVVDDFETKLAASSSAMLGSDGDAHSADAQPLYDYTIQLPEFEVPGDGFDGNKFLLIDPGITRDVLAVIQLTPVKGAESIHHAGLLLYTEDLGGPPDDDKLVDLVTHQGSGVSGWLPGMTTSEKAGLAPGKYPGETAILLPAGRKLVGQFHLQSKGEVGRVAQMQMRVQIFDPDVVKYVPDVYYVWKVNFTIPPHAENHEIRTTRVLNRDIVAAGFGVHGHKRLKRAHVEATLPDGEELLLLDADYSEDWQWTYFLPEEFFLPEGTTIDSVFTYENTEDYLAGAADPAQVVRSGYRTTDEMCRFNIICRQSADEVKRMLASDESGEPPFDRERIRVEPVDISMRFIK